MGVAEDAPVQRIERRGQPARPGPVGRAGREELEGDGADAAGSAAGPAPSGRPTSSSTGIRGTSPYRA